IRTDRSVAIRDSVHDVKFTMLLTIVLVVLVIFLFLRNISATVIPSLALPASIVATFAVMYLLDYSLDNLSLMALTLAIGFLVDDAIVFLENTVRRMEHTGESAIVAAGKSARQISFTILAMTLSLATVFLPLVFMSGLVGRIFREFAVTIVVSIIASGVVSLTLTPLMCARMLGKRGHGARKTVMERGFGAIERLVLRIYGATLWFFLRQRWISAILWAACLVGTIHLLQVVPKSFLPTGDSGLMFGPLIGQEGSSPKQMQQYQTLADNVVRSNPAVKTAMSVTGISGFMPANQGVMIVFLKDRKDRPPIADVARQLMGGITMGVPGAMGVMIPQAVLEISTGATDRTRGDLAFTVSGLNASEVYDIGRKLQFALMGRQDMFLNVLSDLYTSTPQLAIDIQRDRAAMYGVSVSRIETLLRNAYSQNYVYLIKRPDDQYQVILEVRDRERTEPQDLEKLYVSSDDGKNLIPLNAVADWRYTVGPQSVNHTNQFSSVTVNFNMVPGMPMGEATQLIENTAKELLPPGMRGEFQGKALIFKDTVRDLTIMMLLAVFVMYVILGVLYESFIHPITVLSTLPPALIGGLATLAYFGMDASLYAFIGLFMLMGIVKKNGIMIVDFAVQRAAEGLTPMEAIHAASMDRFRPILMTTLAAIMGAIPIALGYGTDGEGRRPLGLVLVGGLIVSQFITLYITPAIYLYMQSVSDLLTRRKSKPAAGGGEPLRAIPVVATAGGGNGDE
ncbi:MAG: efflux RND transporter permease subunit, partial [Tepidisphaerales bacterium]